MTSPSASILVTFDEPTAPPLELEIPGDRYPTCDAIVAALRRAATQIAAHGAAHGHDPRDLRLAAATPPGAKWRYEVDVVRQQGDGPETLIVEATSEQHARFQAKFVAACYDTSGTLDEPPRLADLDAFLDAMERVSVFATYL